jgi:hypothetical protein
VEKPVNRGRQHAVMEVVEKDAVGTSRLRRLGGRTRAEPDWHGAQL